MKTLIKKILRRSWLFMVGCAMLSACTKYDTPDSIAAGTDALDSVKQSVKRYVLWVNIDGAAGSLVKQEVENGSMPNLKAMLANSKYMWSGISDDHSIDNGKKPEGRTEEDPVTWTSMLTGVNSNLHRVNSYAYTPEFDLDNNSTASYFPNIVHYLSQKDPSATMSCVTPWEHLNKYLNGMQSVKTTSGDDETLSTLMDQLKNDDYRLTIASFRSVQDAGKTGGFTLNNANYVNSLKKTDEALKQLLDAINNRPNAYYEDWLVCVTSDHGGTASGEYGGSSDAERDIFGVFYYPHYTSVEMKGSTLEAMKLPKTAALAKDSVLKYIMGRNNSLAFELVMRNNARSNGSYLGNNWDRLFGKKGWGFFRQRSQVVFRTEGTGSTQIDAPHGAPSSYTDALWHTVYSGVEPMNGNSRGYVYGLDGVEKHQTEIDSWGIENDSSYLQLGGKQPTVFYIAAARIWNKQLSAVELNEVSSLVTIPETKSYRKNLIGEWRFSPDQLENDTVIPNLVKGGAPFIFSEKPAFVKVANTLPAYLENNRIEMENTLVLPQVMYWLLGTNGIDSRMEGYLFLSKYNLEEQWRDADPAIVKKE